jgi:hypothetical protein
MALNFPMYEALHDASNGVNIPAEMAFRLRDRGLVERATDPEAEPTFSPRLAPGGWYGDPHRLTEAGWLAVENG